MKIFKNTKTEPSDIEKFHVEYGGKITIMNYEEYESLKTQIKILEKKLESVQCKLSSKEKDFICLNKAYKTLGFNFKNLQDKYNKFTQYQNRKGFNKEFAYDCFVLIYQNQQLSVQQIYENLNPKHNLGYEATRLYVKAIREGRIRPVMQNGQVTDMEGRLN